MSYVTTKANDKPDIYQKYAQLRTEVRTKNETLRNAYERQANDRLRETIEKERRHFQAQVDEVTATAQAAIDRSYAEAEHWRKQCEEIYAILEDTTAQAEAEISRLTKEVERLEKDNARLRTLKSKSGKTKRLMNRE